jgi:PAS domain-containing protein
MSVSCAGAASEAQQGAILQGAHDAIVTMDANLNIREFNPAAEQMSAIRAWLVRPLGGREQQLDGSAKPDEQGVRPSAAAASAGRGCRKRPSEGDQAVMRE